jgi:class 3 adenylate cyclase/predicted ATPase
MPPVAPDGGSRMACPTCGGAVPAGRFCIACGAALVACPACGAAALPEARFCAQCGHRLSPPEAAPAAPRQTPRGPERRHLTVLFCDLVGSTALSGRLDPEDVGALMRAYRNCCTEVVKRWGGHVARFLGDGVLAYFGFPRANEDDAERAVRAGLELTEAVARLAVGGDVALATRVGIATGQVLVGELIGEGAAQEEAVFGETPNLAARLQALAEPGAVVIAASTRRLVGSLFALTDLGPQPLKGFAEPVPVFQVGGEGRAEGRFEALRGRHVTPLVGRANELAILMERWVWTREGDGQVALLSGEPGIGKSRLLRALRERLADQPHAVLSHFCSPHHTNSALHPVITQLERAAGCAAEDGPATKLARLETLFGPDSDEAVVLTAALLAVPTEGRYPPLNLTPQRQKQRTLEVLLDQLEALSRRRPTLVLFEDAHWADPSTLEFIDLLVERVRAIPTLLLLTFRPEFAPSWIGQGHVTQLPLNRLGRRQGAALVQQVCGDKALPQEVLDQVLEKTDGVPLFMEELTKTVLESGLLRAVGDRYELTGPIPSIAIPATVHDSLMARLDRLAPVREVAQTAAAIGRRFSFQLLSAVSHLEVEELCQALDQLTDAELIFCRGSPPHAIYTFKHALVQDAAYQSLLRSRRAVLHARILAALEQDSPEIKELEPELFAHHATQAGKVEEAVRYWHAAGERALERSANAEAVGHLTKGLELLREFPDPTLRGALELSLRLTLGPALIATKGQTAGAVGENYNRARQLAGEIGEDTQTFRALFGLWQFHLLRAELHTARELSEQCAAMARERDDPELLIGSCRALGAAQYYLGEFVAARATLEEGVALAKRLPRRCHPYAFLADPRVNCRTYLSRTLWTLGYPDQAAALGDEALVLAEASQHAFTLANNLGLIAGLQVSLRDVGRAARLAELLIELSSEQGFPYWLANGLLWRGWARVGRGEIEAGIADLHDSVARFRAHGNAITVAHGLNMLADAYRQAGRAEEGLEVLAELEPRDERRHAAESRRLEGDLLALTGQAEAADDRYRLALAIAREQSAKAFELRAATSRARLLRAQDRRAEARDLLAPVYGWFTEGFATPDLKDASALLDDLA